MQPHEQTQFLSAIAKFVKDQVATATAPLLERIAALEGRPVLAVDDVSKRVNEIIKSDKEVGLLADFDETVSCVMHQVRNTLKELGLAVEDPENLKLVPVKVRDGVDGKDAELDFDYINRSICDAVVQHFKDFPVENGKDGKNGTDGKDGKDADMNVLIEMCKEWAVGTVAKLYEDGAIKSGKDGKDGRDGRDGVDGKTVSLDEITALVNDAVADLPAPRHVVSGYIDRNGDLHHVLSDGTDVSFGKVVGRDGVDGKDAKGEAGQNGKDGKDGKDGLGFKDMSVTFDGERDLVFKFVLEERVEELALTIPFMIYRGVWKAGEYKRGDTITRDGSLYVAIRDTDAQPGTVESGWQLAAKRGRDGRDLEGKK